MYFTPDRSSPADLPREVNRRASYPVETGGGSAGIARSDVLFEGEESGGAEQKR
jgi:hypothetical protein